MVLSLKNKYVQFLLFLLATWFLFTAIFFLGTNPTKLIDWAFQKLFLYLWNTVDIIVLRDFLVFGLFTGIAGFLVYVPNIMLLFLFSHILFESGLTVKAARALDPFFRIFGLNGYSFPSLLFGFGCSVNALHSAENIKNKDNKLLTMLIAPFMSCGAKFAVYVLLISIVFGTKWAGTVMLVLYLIGITFALMSALIFRMFFKIKKDDTVVHLPDVPLKKVDFKRVGIHTLRDGWFFCKRAGTVIVVTSILIWASSYWPGISVEKYNEIKKQAEISGQPIPSRITYSFHMSALAKFGRIIEPVFRPMGQDWKNSVAIVSSLAGRGIIISTLITIYGIEYTPQGRKTLAHALQADEIFSKLSAMALMLFVLLCGSCLASITMFLNHTKSWFLTGIFVIYPIISAWVISVIFYQIGRIIV